MEPPDCQALGLFILSQKLYQWVLAARPFASNFLFLILAVSVKVSAGAGTISSPALPQLPPTPRGNSLVLGGQGLLAHVRLFSQSSPDWHSSLLDGFGGGVRSREPCTAPRLAPRFIRTSVCVFSGHLLSFCCVPDTLSTRRKQVATAPGLRSSR